MWHHENGRAVLDLGKVDRSEFKVVDDPQRNLHLVFPKKGKWDWKDEEKWLRSVVVDGTGLIVSCSWKKFGNYGEFLDETDILKRELECGGPVRWTEKMDGSLCIRSVVGGEVIMRTRGTLYGGASTDDEEGRIPFGDRFRKVAQEKYPRLLDPTWVPEGKSLLLEYISPDNVVVVRNKEEDLVFLGGVDHCGPSILTWEETLELAVEGGLRTVGLRELPHNPLLMLEEVKGWKGSEGVVVRCCRDQIFVKVKSDWYKANHLMKSQMNYLTIAEFLEQSDIQSEQQLEEFLHSFEYDFEIIESAKVLYARCKVAEGLALDMRQEAERKLKEFEASGGALIEPQSAKRKEYAKIACTQRPVIKSMMFSLYDGKEQQVKNMIRKVIRNEGKLK